MISVALGAMSGFADMSPRFQAVLDIFLSHNLQFPTMIGGENQGKDAHSASTAEKQTLIFRPENLFRTNILVLDIDSRLDLSFFRDGGYRFRAY